MSTATGPNGPQSHKHAQYCSYKLHGCPCGYYGDPVKECTCSSTLIARYQKKIGDPPLDSAWEEGRRQSLTQVVEQVLN